MKHIVFFVTTFLAISAQTQPAPEYKVPVPSRVVLNHSCMTGNMQQIFQSVAGISDPNSAQFTDVVSDAAGNLYFTGYADFTTTPSADPNYPYAGPEITFSSNVSPSARQRLPNHKHFLASFHPNGSLRWVNFFTEYPKKMLLNEAEQKLFLLFAATGNGIGFNGTHFPLDSAYQGDEHVIFTLEPNGGIFQGIYKNRYTEDLIVAGNKTILIYYRQYSSNYYEIRYGFFEDNQVLKWQLPTTQMYGYGKIDELHYNPYDNSLWFLNYAGNKYYRLFVHNSLDTLIFEDVPRNLNQEVGIPIQEIKTIDKFHFLPNGGYVGEYYTAHLVWGQQKALKIVRVDSSGNVLWRTEFPPHNGIWHTALVDGNGDVWVDLPTTSYYDKFKAVTAGKEYTINPWGNVGIVNNYLLKLDGGNGDIKAAYINGYGNVNYAMEISPYTKMQLLHLTASNKLITTPQIGGVAYYPDANRNFQPYYATCSNQILPSQFMWVSFDLNNLQAFKREELGEENIQNLSGTSAAIPLLSVYPNPSRNNFTLVSTKEQVFELYDITGRQLDTIKVEINQPYIYEHKLTQGTYVLRGREFGSMSKIIVTD